MSDLRRFPRGTWRRGLLPVVLIALATVATAAGPPDTARLRETVRATEMAFAKTLADRDHSAFTRFLSDEAIFFDGNTPTRGKAAVAASWKPLFDPPKAPFSWEPDTVEVLDSGTLALSSGPVRDPGGKVVGRFSSIWRQEAPGQWRIVFDKGCDVCAACPEH